MPEIREGQTVALLQELHILTRDGKMNQDSRRKLKQVYHLYQFIEPLLKEVLAQGQRFAGRPRRRQVLPGLHHLRPVLQGADAGWLAHLRHRNARRAGQRSQELAQQFNFPGMSFLPLSVAESTESKLLPEQIDIVTALHACNTATDDAIHFALKKKARYMVLVPCCQAEVASVLKKNKGKSLAKSALTEIWRHPIHTREFGSQITNVLRCLQLEAHGYQVNVTELVGWEHSMKNELIIATYKDLPRSASQRLQEVLETLGLEEMGQRFYTQQVAAQTT
jgi:hypothetical protein